MICRQRKLWTFGRKQASWGICSIATSYSFTGLSMNGRLASLFNNNLLILSPSPLWWRRSTDRRWNPFCAMKAKTLTICSGWRFWLTPRVGWSTCTRSSRHFCTLTSLHAIYWLIGRHVGTRKRIASWKWVALFWIITFTFLNFKVADFGMSRKKRIHKFDNRFNQIFIF